MYYYMFNNTLMEYLNVVAEDPKALSESEIHEIYLILQDIRSREEWLGELCECESCDIVYSKEDIFWHIPRQLYVEKVGTILDRGWYDTISCKQCHWDTQLLYPESYKQNIASRYQEKESYVAVWRNKKWEIHAYMDGYVDCFDVIFNDLFGVYYTENAQEFIEEVLRNTIKAQIPEKMLVWSGIGMAEKHKNFFVIYRLIKAFFEKVWENNLGIMGIAESKLGTNMNALYDTMGWERLHINDKFSRFFHRHSTNDTDMYVQRDPIKDYTTRFQKPVKDFLKENRHMLHKIMA